MFALMPKGEPHNRSVWELPLPTGVLPAFRQKNVHVDTVVVGAGLTGLSAALHLLEASPGRDVVVLDGGNFGGGASGRSTGMLTPGVGQNLSSLIQRYGSDKARALYRETLAAVSYAERLVARLQIDCQLRMTGQLIVLPRRGRMQNRLQTLIDAFERLDLPHEPWDLQKLSQRARFAVPQGPAATEEPVALRLPNAGTLHPGLLLDGLANKVLRLGGKIHEHSQVTSVSGSAHVSVLTRDGGSLKARNVVWATSGYDAERRFFKGRVLPVHLGVVATEPLDTSQMAALGWPGRECAIDCRRLFNYFRLTEDNRIVFGGGAPRYRWGGSLRQPQGSQEDLRGLANELSEVFAHAGGLRISSAWTGVIGYVVDTVPTIRWLEDKGTVLYAGAWSGHGIALSIQSGLWVRQLIDEGAAPNDLPWFTHTPPLLPTEPLRWCGFKAVVQTMALLDAFWPDGRAPASAPNRLASGDAES